MMKNTFISLLILMSVFTFVHRIFFEFKKQHIFPLKILTKIVTFYFCFLITLYFYFFNQPFLIWIFAFLSFLLFPILIFCLKRFHQHQFHGEFLRFLSLVVMSMQRGLSFPTAMESSLRVGNWKQDQLLRRIYEDVVFSQQELSHQTGLFGQYIDQIRDELTRVSEHQHQAIDRLCNFRKNLRDRLIFRQKSRQIWSYFTYQVGLLSFIYIGLLVFILKEYGFKPYWFSFFLSFSLYFSGLLFTYWIARSKKWHI